MSVRGNWRSKGCLHVVRQNDYPINVMNAEGPWLLLCSVGEVSVHKTSD